MYASWHLSKKGTILRAEYPYTGAVGTCQEDSFTKQFYLTGNGFESIGKSKAEFKAALRKQVINISFAVMGNDFYQYTSGVIGTENCS